MNDLDKLEQLLLLSGATCWRIESKDGRKRAEFESDNIQDSITALQNRFEHLSYGKYTFKYRKAGKTANSQDSEDFEVLKANTTMTHHNPQPYNTTPYGDYAEVIRRLIQIELEFKYFVEANNKRLEGLEKVFNDLNDDDESNDKSAMSKFAELIETAPKISNAIKSFRHAS